MQWYPLKLSTPLARQCFGGERLRTRLGKAIDTQKRVAEAWEVSDVEGASARIENGELAGLSLHDVFEQHKEALMGPHWQGPPHFPLLYKFIDGTGMLPVHVHADDDTARRQGIWHHGKTEAWHILWCEPGATLLLGVKAGVTHERLREALLAQDYDTVMHRYSLRPGDTFYVPAGTLHSFGPGVVLGEIQQTADILEQAMPWEMADGAPLSQEQWEANIEATLGQLNLDQQSQPHPGLVIHDGEHIERRFCCAGPWFAMERIVFTRGYRRSFDRAVLLSNPDAPITVRWANGETQLPRAESLLLPAALGEIELVGKGDVLMHYEPDLEHDVVAPLMAAGYSQHEIEQLGDIGVR
ncbi:mannose-6-phosphate isomerase [Kushneria phosphatilytica]|uniref:Mannose-6-phosphate isomerase n=1 Tax=Kushneria phosphatilytica TaxID=657387 RepID=A0A5C1A1A4_9GAMM|nr:type I phosphomannose isomerase catalytic subunit [Kushneria phosphatilytica]QEL11906.1 mannose-6-phosphate isomerase [Kushneria phosphatilytica]